MTRADVNESSGEDCRMTLTLTLTLTFTTSYTTTTTVPNMR